MGVLSPHHTQLPSHVRDLAAAEIPPLAQATSATSVLVSLACSSDWTEQQNTAGLPCLDSAIRALEGPAEMQTERRQQATNMPSAFA